jgi:hypothetical protein
MPIVNRFRRLVLSLALAAGLVPALASSGPTHKPALRSGLYGHATMGPLMPVCRRDVPCRGPAAHVTLLFLRGERIIEGTETDAEGRYGIALKPGRYSIASTIGFGVVEPDTVTVLHGHFTRVDLSLDTGIR